jgi:hypothetical protein
VFTAVVYRRFGVSRELVASRAVVDAGGHFAVRVEPGRYDVVVRAFGWAQSPALPATPGRDIEVVVSEGARVSGTVVSATTGAPIAGARLDIEGLGTGHSPLYDAGGVTRADGTFELRGLPVGALSIAVFAADFDGRIEGGLVGHDGAVLGPLTVPLVPKAPGAHPMIDYVGLGITTRPDGDDLMIDEVFPDGGAYAAGIVPGDRIVTIDGEAVAEIGSEAAIVHIHGLPNTTIVLGLRRDGAIRPVVVQRTRRRTT